MGVFGAPVTYGDDAERAVRAAFAVRDWAEHEGLQLRVAVNTGEAIVALDASPDRGETFVAGDVVNTAARLQSASPVGAVLVGEETLRGHARIDRVPARPACRGEGKGGSGPGLARPSAHRRHRGAAGGARPDDRPRPRARRAHRHLGSRRRRGEKPLRDRVRTGGHRQVAHRARTRAARGRTGRACDPWPLHPLRRFEPVQRVRPAGEADRTDLRQRRRHRSESEARRRDRLARGSRSGRGARAESRSPARVSRKKARSPTASSSSSPRVSSSNPSRCAVPTLLIYEDIHWADASLLDLLETFAARVRDVPVLFLALARPELLG